MYEKGLRFVSLKPYSDQRRWDGGTEVPVGSKGGWTNNPDCLSPSGILQNHRGRDRAERGHQTTGGCNGNDGFGDLQHQSRRSNQLFVDCEKTNWNYHWVTVRKQAINQKSIKDKQTYTWLGARFPEVTHHLHIKACGGEQTDSFCDAPLAWTQR